MSITYREIVKFDDIAFRALKISLSEPDRSLIIERLTQDWGLDVGVIGVIRKTHLDSGSSIVAAQLYWSSRREPESPRIESILAALLMNLASSLIYDVLKEYASQNYDMSTIMSAKDLPLSTIVNVGADIPKMINDVRAFFGLWKAKNSIALEGEVRTAILRVAEGKTSNIPDLYDAQRLTQNLLANLEPAIRGLIKQELEKSGVYTADEADGVLIKGLAASPGYGKAELQIYKTGENLITKDYILFISDKEVSLGNDYATKSIEKSVAVISWDGRMTSHVAVFCRGIRKPLVMIERNLVDLVRRKKFAGVDGTNGEIRLYNNVVY